MLARSSMSMQPAITSCCRAVNNGARPPRSLLEGWIRPRFRNVERKGSVLGLLMKRLPLKMPSSSSEEQWASGPKA